MKTILVIGAGREAIPGLQHAKAIGYRIVATDGNPHAPGFAYADAQLVTSTYDAPATIQQALHYHTSVWHIDGVIALAADVPVTVARVARALRLPGLSLMTAYLSQDKYAQKRRLEQAGIPVPWFSRVVSIANLEALVADHAKRESLLVIKSVDSRGARGVVRLLPTVDVAWAFQQAQACSPTGRVMVEEWLAGPQISTESVIGANWATTPGFIERNYARLDEFAPFCIEDGGQQPSALSGADQAAVAQMAERAARALGIANWTAKGDMVLTRDGPKVIELAARLSGGWMSSVQVPTATGVDLVGIALRLAVGPPVTQEECLPQRQNGCAIRYYFAVPGRATAIHGIEAVRQLPDISRVEVFVAEGDIVQSPMNHTQRAACVIATGKTRQEAVARAEQAVGMIQVDTEHI